MAGDARLHAACFDTTSVEAVGYGRFLDILVGDEALGGFPLLLDGEWEEDNFSLEAVAGANSR